MPKVTFLPSKKTLNVEAGTTLFDAALSAGLPVASSCNADGVCGRCNMSVKKGLLSAVTEWEQKLLQRDGRPLPDRISCLTKVLGDCEVTTSYW